MPKIKKPKTKKDFRERLLKIIDDNKDDFEDDGLRNLVMHLRAQIEISLRE